MFRNFLLLFTLLFVSMGLLAQTPGLPKPVRLFMKKTLPTNKSNSLAYRLIAETNLGDEGSGFGPIDSTTYVYRNNDTEAYDSSYSYQWMGSSWEPQQLEVNVYNAQGQLTATKGFYYAGPGWEQNSRGAATYDAAGNVLTLIYEEHDGSAWDTTLKFVNVYQNNRPVEETMYQNQGSGLEPFFRTLTHYNAQGLADTVETQLSVGVWMGAEKVVYTYNTAGKVLTQTTYNGDFMGGYDPSERQTFTYNNNGYLAQELLENHDGTTWVNANRIFYQLNGQGLVLDWLKESWSGSNWLEDRQGENFYTNGKLDSTLVQQKLGNSWVNEGSTSFAYDAQGNTTVTKEYSWNGGAWELVTENRKYYGAYNGPTGIGDKPDMIVGFSVYPNPVQSVATFAFTAQRDCIAALAIYDLAGRQIFAIGSQAVAGQNVLYFDTVNLPSGSYLYKLKVDGKTASGVLVK